MLSDPEFKKMAETLTGRKLASEIVGASEPDPELLALGQEQLKKAFLDGATKQVSDWWGRQGGDTQNALRGAGIGAGLGAATGLMTGRRRPFRDAVLGGVLGGGLGAVAGGLGSSVTKTLNDPKRQSNAARDRIVTQAGQTQGKADWSSLRNVTDSKTVLGGGFQGAGLGVATVGGLSALASSPGSRRYGLGRGAVWGGPTGAILGAGQALQRQNFGLGNKDIKSQVAEGNSAVGAFTDATLKLQAAGLVKQLESGAINHDEFSAAMSKLTGLDIGKQLTPAAPAAPGNFDVNGKVPRSHVYKRAGTWDDVKAWGSGLGDKAQAYWTLGKDEFNKNPELQRGLYGAGIGAAAGGLLGATNRKRRGVSMLAGMLGGGLLGAGGGVLSSRMGVGGESPPPASGTPPPVADEAAAKPAPSNSGPAVLRNLGAAAGTAAGMRYGPSAIRNVAEVTRGITDVTGNEAAAYRAKVTGELDQGTDNLNKMRAEMLSGNNTKHRYSLGSEYPLRPREYTPIPKGYFDTLGRVETLRPKVDALDHELDLYQRRPLLGSNNRLRAVGGIAGGLGGSLFGLAGRFSQPAAGQPQENK